MRSKTPSSLREEGQAPKLREIKAQRISRWLLDTGRLPMVGILGKNSIISRILPFFPLTRREESL